MNQNFVKSFADILVSDEVERAKLYDRYAKQSEAAEAIKNGLHEEMTFNFEAIREPYSVNGQNTYRNRYFLQLNYNRP